MSTREAIFKKARLITQKWRNVRDEIFREARSTTQRRLNIEKPPHTGLSFKKNTVDLRGPDSVILRNKNGKIVFSPFHHGIFRVYLQSVFKKEAWCEQNSWTIDLANTNRDGWRFQQTKDSAEFSCTLKNGLEAQLQLDVSEGTLSCRIGSDVVMVEPFPPQTTREWLLVKKHLVHSGGVSVFGLGENTPPMNKAGQRIIMWNTSPIKYGIGANPLYQSWPVVIFQHLDGPAFGLVFDNPSYSEFTFSPDGKRMHYTVKDTELNYFILLGPTLPELMGQLASLTGALLPLPKWTLGYQQSRWSYTPSSRVREIAAEFRNRDIPCDVIYLDIDYMEQYKCFTWGEAFKDYNELIKELHRHGFKIVPILDPGLKIEPGYPPYDTGVSRKMFVVHPDGRNVAKRVWAGPSHFPDFLNPSVREWWGELVDEFVKSGVDGLWCDMNEPSTFDLRRTLPPDVLHKPSETKTLPHKGAHNLYGFLMSRATCEGLQKTTPLPYVITRSTFLGGQKYATTWTGDNISSWEHFRASIPMILNLGLSGQPVVGPDIGGFRGTPSPELYQRWILQGALYPYSRTHTDRGTNDQEPWSFGPEVETSARKALKLRYRLIPYLYSLLFEAVQTGQPIMRPIFYHAPTGETLKPEFYETQFLLGPSLLVAPLMDRAPTRTCCLPPGKWYSWWCRKDREGGRRYKTIAEEDTDLPLFVSENAVIPVYPEAPSFIPAHSLESLEIIIVVKDQAEGMVVEYFDRESLLAYEVQFRIRTGYLEGEMNVKRQGNVPAGYQPPQTLFIRLNHPIRNVQLRSGHKACSIASDPANGSWSRITIHNPAFPLSGNFVLTS